MAAFAGMTMWVPPKSRSFGRLVVRRETDKEQEVEVLYGEDLAAAQE